MNITRWTSRPQSASDDGDFRYDVLRSSKTGIRLVQLQPGTGTRAISINLIESYVTGTSRVQYDALSYTWGSGARDKNIFCNGKRLRVTRTLWEALNRFRSPTEELTLWIDQICIAQDWLKERSAQVQLMGEIFKGARTVIVWLGDDSDDSRAGMQLAQQLLHISLYQQVSGLGPSDLETHGLPRQGHKRWKALAQILRRPWFWRTWIVQEVVLNPHVDLLLGTNSLTWEELERVVALLDGPLPRVWQIDQAITASELPFSRINRIRLRHQKLIATSVTPIQSDELLDSPPQSQSQVYSEPQSYDGDTDDAPDLLDLLLMSRDLGATDPRDKVYALLGLGNHDIYPDYTMSPESVFSKFALHTIGLVTAMIERETSAQGLTPLDHTLSCNTREVRRALILMSCAGRQNQSLKLPSWVPDWTTNLRSRPLIFGLNLFGQRHRRFSAGGDRLGVFDWSPDHGLQLCGKLFDTVLAVGNVKLDQDLLEASPATAHERIAAWWQEAQHISHLRIVRSPGSTGFTDAFELMRRSLSICKHGYYDPRSPNHHNSNPQRRNSLLDETDITAQPGHSALHTLTLGPTRGRVVFVTATGWVGIAPYGTQAGDVVFVIMGADAPFILRPCGTDAYEIIGECYVQGIMSGEAMEMDWLGVVDIMIR
nr:hypothetical protein B0A51_03156 [Rachicladosporium sp. CCFEE 5018]